MPESLFTTKSDIHTDFNTAWRTPWQPSDSPRPLRIQHVPKGPDQALFVVAQTLLTIISSLLWWDPLYRVRACSVFSTWKFTANGFRPYLRPRQWFSTCGSQPLLRSHIRYPTYQIFTLWFMTGAELQIWSSSKIISWLGVPIIWETMKEPQH